MKIVIGIVLIALVLLGLIAYLVLMLNAREMIFCGDVQNQTGTSASVTRVYTTDLSANETLSEIIVKMNESQDGSVAVEDLTTVLAQYQNIIYAPVFTVDIQQVDTATYIINGTVYNGIDANGNEAEPDYRYRDMNLGTVVTDGTIIAAQNVYDEDKEENTDPVFIQRQNVIDPVIKGEASEASFALQDCSSFRMIVHGTNTQTLPVVTFVFIYNVDAENPLDFTSISNDSLAVNMTIAYDDKGELAPTYELVKTVTADTEELINGRK